MNIDISNAHCGPRIQFRDHAWLRVVLVPVTLLAPSRRGPPGPPVAYERSLDVRPAVRRGRRASPRASSEMREETHGREPYAEEGGRWLRERDTMRADVYIRVAPPGDARSAESGYREEERVSQSLSLSLSIRSRAPSRGSRPAFVVSHSPLPLSRLAREPTACPSPRNQRGVRSREGGRTRALSQREKRGPARVVVYSRRRDDPAYRGPLCPRAVSRSAHTHITLTTSEQARSPAEFKHIIKRRKRN